MVSGEIIRLGIVFENGNGRGRVAVFWPAFVCWGTLVLLQLLNRFSLWPEIDRGYANQTLYVNVSEADMAIKPVSEEMKHIFVGGKGFDLWLLWNAVKGNLSVMSCDHRFYIVEPKTKPLHIMNVARRYAVKPVEDLLLLICLNPYSIVL